jgi:dihydrolipoamide dehydrogenase
MTKSFQSRGIDIQTNVKVQQIQNKNSHVTITLNDGKTIDADIALVAVGRKIDTEGLNLQKAGLAVNEKGAIDTDDQMQTAAAGIYAIGDVTGKWMLAHVASHQGIVAASNAAGREMQIHYEAVPSVIFTAPEIATVGLTLEQAQESGYLSAAAHLFPFQALGKALASRETQGFSQIISDQKTGQILGAQIIGHDASNLIAEMALAIQNELTLDSITQTIHAHPTLSECWLETAAMAKDSPIHFPPRMKR